MTFATACLARPASADTSLPRPAEDHTVFEAFTRIERASEPAVIGIRRRTGFTAEISKQVGRIGEGDGAMETAWNVIRASVSVPLVLAKSVLETALEPLSDAPPPPNRGSGFIIDERGHVITALETIENVDALEGSLSDGRTVSLRVVGTDRETGLALLALPSDLKRGKRAPKLGLGDSDSVRVNQWVMAMGVPVGDNATATVGVVSALGKDLDIGPFDEYVQTDAAVVAGLAGGPLFDQNGTVVGIMSFAAARGQNAGFAIPIDAAKGALPDLEQGRAPARGKLGATYLRVAGERKIQYGVRVDSGALVTGLDVDGPAARAGIMLGDVIVAVNGQPTRMPRDVNLELRDIPVGKTATLTLDRKGTRFDATVTIAARAAESAP